VFEAIAVYEDGVARPAWARAVTRRPLRTRRVAAERLRRPDWASRVRRLAAALDPARRPVALAALFVGDVTEV
jgi:hypothetical protein